MCNFKTFLRGEKTTLNVKNTKKANSMSTITDFLIDISDNMSKKLPIAQKAIKDEIIPLLNFSDPIGLRTFLSIVKSPIVINSIDLGLTNEHDFSEKIEKLPIPNGGFPIGYTVQKSLAAMKGRDADKKRIILVTAGMETDGGNYEFEVEKSKKDGSIQVNVIGLGLTGFEEKMAQKVANISNGVFCNLALENSGDRLATKTTLQPLIDILNGKESLNSVANAEKTNGESTPEKKEEFATEVKQEQTSTQTTEAAEKKGKDTEPIQTAIKTEAPKVGITPKAEMTQPTQKKTVVIFEDNAPIDSKLFASENKEDDKTDAIKQIEAKNTEISNILNENIKTIHDFLNKEKEKNEEIEKLRNAGKESLKKVEELKEINRNAQAEIEKLESLVTEKENKIKALLSVQEADKEEISKLKQIDEEVILLEDKEKIHRTSQKSEEIVYQLLQKKYPDRVNWTNKTEKQEKGYDFEIMFDNENIEYYIACKGKVDSSKTFFLTKQEWELCLENNRNYQVYLVNDINGSPKTTIIDNLMGWILNGRVRPYAQKNQKVKSERVMFTLIG